MPSRPRIFYGWWIAWAYFLLNFYWGGALLVGFSALFNPIRDSFGLSSLVATAAIQMRQGAAVVGSPIVGYLFDRFGPRPLILAATFFTAGGMSLLAFSHSTWQFFLAFAIASVGFAIFIAGTGPAAMVNWFVRQRGRAISVVLAGAGVGTLLVRVVVWLEDDWGWRTAVVIIVVGLLIVGLPLSMALRHRPEDYGMRPDGDPPDEAPSEGAPVPVTDPPAGNANDYGFRQALATRTFWFMSVASGFAALGSTSVAFFFIPHLEDEGLSAATAAWAATAVGIIGVGSTLAAGWLSDYAHRGVMLLVAYALQGGGIAIFAFSSSVWHLAFFAVLFGIGARATFPVVSSLLADYFGRANFGKIQGVMFSAFTAGGVAGPLIAARVHDVYGTYTPVFAGYAAAMGVSMIAISLVRRPPSPAATA
ncbi:MAG: MFS transporter [Chloroflexi bacterium]|nr:MFS transporter [Chloroflexota bacterium]